MVDQADDPMRRPQCAASPSLIAPRLLLAGFEHRMIANDARQEARERDGIRSSPASGSTTCDGKRA